MNTCSCPYFIFQSLWIKHKYNFKKKLICGKVQIKKKLRKCINRFNPVTLLCLSHEFQSTYVVDPFMRNDLI